MAIPMRMYKAETNAGFIMQGCLSKITDQPTVGH